MTFCETLDRRIEEKNMLDHPFYQLWARGELDLDLLRIYAKQYYHLVAFFPRLVSAVHSNCPDPGIRRTILENLLDEETGGSVTEPHHDLWINFGIAIGLTRQEMENTPPGSATTALLEELRELTRNRSFEEGVGALYAYESQIPAIAEKKKEGLIAFYNIVDDKGLSFFDVHMEVDRAHRQTWRELIESSVVTEDDRARVESSVNRSLEALWGFLDGVMDHRVE